MRLFKIENGIGTYWVIAENPGEAEIKLLQVLNDADYGFSDRRKIMRIDVIAEAIDDTRFLTGKFLLTQ